MPSWHKISYTILNLTHTKHGPYRDEDIIGINFLKVMKRRIEKENSKSDAELYREEQSKMIAQLGDMALVANSIPQLTKISSGLYKHKAKFIPHVTES